MIKQNTLWNSQNARYKQPPPPQKVSLILENRRIAGAKKKSWDLDWPPEGVNTADGIDQAKLAPSDYYSPKKNLPY